VLFYFRHCEERKRRSNPAYFVVMDCFASLAMTTSAAVP